MKNRFIQTITSYKSRIILVSILAWLLISSQILFGRNFYFSSISGDDTRTSTQAQNSATPWKTITKLNTFFTSLLPGDSVLFKRGEVFYGSIKVVKSGTSTQPIFISAFGTGEKPIVTGFTTLTSWTNEGNGIYSKSITCESKPNILVINGVQYGMGRFPNSGSNLIVDSHNTNISITDADLNSAILNWTGAEAVIRKNEFSMDRCLITNHSGSTLTYNNLSTQQDALDGYYYFIQNDLRTLDQFGEWFYNGTKIYVYFGSQIPTNYIVKIPSIDKLINIVNFGYISVINVAIEGSGNTAVYCETTNNVIVKNCDINFSCNNGIYFQSLYGIIDNTTINHVSQSGILSLSPFISVTNNSIKNCGIIEGSGFYGSHSIGLSCEGSDNLIQYNLIDSVGYHGIAFAGNRTVIKNNSISNFCSNLNDGGGIYTDQNTYVGRIIDGNIIRNGIGKKGKASYAFIVIGIYLDSFLNDVVVKDNSITKCPSKGIMASNSSNITLKNNTCYDNPSSIYLFEWSLTNTLFNITLEDNIFVAKKADQITLEVQSNHGTFIPFGNADRNFYAKPINDINTIYSYEGAVDLYWNPRTLENWKSYSGQDLNSHKSPIAITDTNDLRFEYNSSKVSKTIMLPSTYVDVKGTIYAGSITLLPYTSAVLIKSSSATVCSATGNISYQIWNNIGSGVDVNSLTSNINYPNNPSSTSLLSSMEGTTNLAENFGARLAGYICAPITGNYTFWIASDDNGELWLSSDNQAANKQKIAYHTAFTNSREWNKYTTQKSASIYLVQGQSYYIEALMKEASGGDNLAVGWLKPGQTGTIPSEIIPGSVLSPLGTVQIINVTSVSLPASTSINVGSTIPISVTVLPSNATNPILSWSSSNPAIATVNSSGLVSGVAIGTATITATSTDGTNKSGSCVLTVSPAPCTASGNISYQIWNNIGSGVDVNSLTSNVNYPNNPSSTSLLSSMEGTTNLAENFGARLAGYLCAPITGNYTFWIASDDNGELWLSSDNQAANKQKIAYHTAFTNSREWNKYTTQKSASIYLVQGQSYYIEALMKEASGGDNLAVGWLKPGQTGTVPSEIVPGTVLSPVEAIQTILVTSVSIPSTATVNAGSTLQITATVFPGNTTNPTLSWSSSNPAIATVNSSGLVSGMAIGTATITATSTDGTNKSGSCVLTVSPAPCTASGNISYQIWNNIGSGVDVNSLTSNVNYPNNPSSTSLLSSMEGTTNLAENFGARLAGYLCAPITGNYTFWIASDDNGELWLSSDNQAANKQKIAYHTAFTNSREWNKYTTQKSASIYLVQGQSYYIEALMKEASGGDNLAVGWLKPGQTGTVPSEIVPGTVLSPVEAIQTILVTSVSIPSTATVNAGSTLQITATVFPGNTTNPTLSWSSSNPAIATVNSSGLVSGVAIGTATITATSTDGTNKSGSCVLTVSPAPCTASGNISYQIWNNIGSGVDVNSLTSNVNYPNNPSSTSLLSSMEGTTNLAENFGARLAGYLCAPITGNYTFWIASDDNGELWLSSDNQAANKQKIAYHTAFTNSREWNKYTTQKSASIYLVQGQSYYIEALMKEASGGDNLAVGWLKPGQTGTVPSEIVPGTVLSPVEAIQTILVTSVSIPSTATVNAGSTLQITATVFPGNTTNPTLSWSSSNPAIATVNSIGLVSGVAIGTATITATSTDGTNKSGSCVLTVSPAPCTASGNISYQIWNNIGSGVDVNSLTSNVNYPNNPSSTSLLSSMEGTTNLAENFGARLAGYLCAPITGNYTFWIASDDNGELWLSSDNQAANKQKIAYHTAFTNSREWNKYTTQKSASIYLVQGQSYYIEALMKEASGGDNLAVGWLKPGQTGTVPSEVVPGTVLSPVDNKSSENNTEDAIIAEMDIIVNIFPNPLTNENLNIKIENLTSVANIKIFSISGIQCFDYQISASETIQLDRNIFKSGIYIVKIFNNSCVKTTKLVVN